MSIATSHVVHGSGINLEQLTQLVADPSKNGVVVELYWKLKKTSLDCRGGDFSL